MFRRSNSELSPRNGKTLVVVIAARISGGPNQKDLSLEDQVDHGKRVIAEIYTGEAEYRVFATTAKGERLDRPELAEIEAQLRSKEVDVLVFEDLSRLARSVVAITLLGLAVDNGTRVISPNDGIDTADTETWEEVALAACRDGVGGNAQTSKRLKQKLKNRFENFGGAPARPIAGYPTPQKKQPYSEWQKDESATPIIRRGMEILLETKNCSAAAEYFNSVGFSVGPYCRRKKWDGRLVRRFFANPLLKGQPQRGARHTVKHYATGRRVSVENPEGPTFYDAPHLAHLDPQEFDELNSILDAHNARHGRPKKNGEDPLKGVSRKRTRFPGQHSTCLYCGRQCVWGGNGITKNLMCAGARESACWNSVGFNGPLAATRIVEAIVTELYKLDGIDDQLSALVGEAFEAAAGDTNSWDKLRAEETQLDRQRANLVDAIADLGPQPMFANKLAEIEASQRSLLQRRRQLETLKSRRLEMPESGTALRRQLEAQLRGLAVDSYEAGQLLRLLVPEFHVYLVRLCDGGHPLPRARIKLSLAGNVAQVQYIPGLRELLSRELSVDLFKPLQREQFRTDAVRLRGQGLKQHAIARQLGITQAAVSKALLLNARMIDAGLSSPYIVLYEPPADYTKLCRHKNSKYEFRPLPGYQPSTI